MLNNNKKIRLFCIRSLIFSFLLVGCSQKDQGGDVIAILWENEKPTGIFIPEKLIDAVPGDSLQLITVRLLGSNTAILGEYSSKEGGVEFKPLLPFTAALTYDVYVREEKIGEMKVPAISTGDAPLIIGVYPSPDTLPENLLKFYIQFSKPMQEGEALQHIRLIKNKTDTQTAVFLDLQPELWNHDRTLLTLWLDPGRIKRDLQPNKALGPPLHAGIHYQLWIDNSWRDARGLELKTGYHKIFYTSSRDSISPDIETWKWDLPAAGTVQSLSIRFPEPLDHVLSQNAIHVKDEKGNALEGNWQVNEAGTVVSFTPTVSWKTGNYSLQAESRMEDLAGNNLNHLFDADLTQKQKAPKDIYTRSFVIR